MTAKKKSKKTAGFRIAAPCTDYLRAERHRLALWKLVNATMTHMHEFGECPFCELGKAGDIGDWTAKHDPDCPLSGFDLTVDLEALRASSGYDSCTAKAEGK